MSTPTVYVASATGTIGRSLCRQLKEADWEVHATTRDIHSKSAEYLSSIGVRLTAGDWDNTDALTASITGCDLLFLNTFPNFQDSTQELLQARRIAQIAKDTGVKQVVYSTGFPVAPVAGGQDAPQWMWDPESVFAKAQAVKRAIEAEIPQMGFDTWTILQPAMFMANFIVDKVDFVHPLATKKGMFIFSFGAETGMPLIDHEDIAKFAVAAFRDPRKFHGQTIPLAAETLPVQEIVGMLATASGTSLRGHYMSDEEIQASDNWMVKTMAITRYMGDRVDVEAAKGWGVQLGDFAGFLEREKAAVRTTFENVESKE